MFQNSFLVKNSKFINKILTLLGYLLVGGVLLSSYLKNPTDRVDLEILLNALSRFVAGEEIYRLSDSLEHTKAPLLVSIMYPLVWIPNALIVQLWNIGVVLSGVYIVLRLQLRSGVGLLALLCVLAQWNREFEVGQYNLIILAILVGTLKSSSLVRALGVWIALLLKPTNLLLLPWYLKDIRKKDLLRFSMQFASMGFVWGGLYAYWRGFGALISDHLAWLKFLPLSTEKHILNSDNLGLPAIYAQELMPFWAPFKSGSFGNLLLLVGVGLLWTLKDRFNSRSLLALSSAMIFFFSPMTWPQNYVLMIPVLIELIESALVAPAKNWITIAILIACYFATQLLNISVVPTNFYEVLRDFKVITISALLLSGAWLLGSKELKG